MVVKRFQFGPKFPQNDYQRQKQHRISQSCTKVALHGKKALKRCAKVAIRNIAELYTLATSVDSEHKTTSIVHATQYYQSASTQHSHK